MRLSKVLKFVTAGIVITFLAAAGWTWHMYTTRQSVWHYVPHKINMYILKHDVPLMIGYVFGTDHYCKSFEEAQELCKKPGDCACDVKTRWRESCDDREPCTQDVATETGCTHREIYLCCGGHSKDCRDGETDDDVLRFQCEPIGDNLPSDLDFQQGQCIPITMFDERDLLGVNDDEGKHCADQFDNDGDGAANCDDMDCLNSPDCDDQPPFEWKFGCREDQIVIDDQCADLSASLR